MHAGATVRLRHTRARSEPNGVPAAATLPIFRNLLVATWSQIWARLCKVLVRMADGFARGRAAACGTDTNCLGFPFFLLALPAGALATSLIVGN